MEKTGGKRQFGESRYRSEYNFNVYVLKGKNDQARGLVVRASGY